MGAGRDFRPKEPGQPGIWAFQKSLCSVHDSEGGWLRAATCSGGFLAFTWPVGQFTIRKAVDISPSQQGLGQAAPEAWTISWTQIKGPNTCHSRDLGQAQDCPHPRPSGSWEVHRLWGGIKWSQCFSLLCGLGQVYCPL